jgi:hypothetical protein
MSPTECALRRFAKLVRLAVPILAAPCVVTGAPTGQASQRTALPSGWSVRYQALSQYERDVLASVLEERQLTLELNPEGRSIETVEAETLEVFESADPLPGWVNWFHTKSRSEVIEREVLISTGQRYDQRAIDESARNLRNLKQLSLVLIVPIRSERSNQVRLLVVTKDVWSLRLNSSIRIRNGTVEYLALQPSEENLAGTHLKLAGQYYYDLSTNTFGATMSHHRLFGSRIRAGLTINAIQYRKTGEFEGSSGTFLFQQPLYSARTKWSWGTSLTWLNRMNRPLLPTPDGAYTARLYRAPDAEPIPYRYQTRMVSWQTAVTRSYGFEQKTNLTLGLESLQRSADASGLIAEGYSPESVHRFERNVLERKSVRIGPFAQLESYRNDYVSMVDFETLGLQEDIQLGPRLFLKVYTGTKHALGTRDLVGVSTGLQYSASLAGSLLRIWATHLTELSPKSEDRDGLVQAGLRMVSPRLGIGRFVYDGGLLYHYQNGRNLRYALGGDNRLRGYPSEQFLGQHVVASNLEFRTRSVKLLEILFGLVGFYDVGDAFDSMRLLHPKHTIGIGGRATIPQLQRVVGRLDLSFPLTSPLGKDAERWSPVAVYLAIEGQAFPFPTVQSGTTRSPLLTPD